MLLEDLLVALARTVHGAVQDERGKALRAALSAGRALIGADVVVLHLPGSDEPLSEVRIPPDVRWPPLSLLERWYAEVSDHVRPITIAAQDESLTSEPRSGIILPLFSSSATGGAVGILGAFSASRAFAAEESTALLVLVQAALARVEAGRLRQQVETATTTEVRDRIARELHDGPLQRLSGLMIHLRNAQDEDEGTRREAAQWLEAELEAVIRQTRLLIHTMRLADAETTLAERIRAALARLERARALTCSLQWQVPEGSLTPAAADQLFQVINEALANIYRHASAKRVDVAGRISNGVLEVTVRDDGIGFDVAKVLRHDIRRLSFGLLSMQERIANLGGTLTLRSQSGRGTRVLINLPLGQMESVQNA